MDSATLHDTVLSSEWNSVIHLQQFGLFNDESKDCPGTLAKPCTSSMRMRVRSCGANRESTVSWICKKKSCRKSISVRDSNRFFSWTDKRGRSNSKLSIRKIVEIVYEFLYTTSTTEQLMLRLALSRETVITWMSLCREVCEQVVVCQTKYFGTELSPIQIDESMFGGRSKYKKGRLLSGDRISKNETQLRQEITKEIGSIDDTADDHVPLTQIQRKSNHGKRVSGPWIFGIYQSRRCVRFFLVDDRTSATLLPIIERCVEKGSYVASDEWSAYRQLTHTGYIHKTVCHKTNFVNPEDGTHTQAIERAWVEAKSYTKQARGGKKWIESHLHEVSWRLMHKKEDLWSEFWIAVHKYITQSNTLYQRDEHPTTT